MQEKILKAGIYSDKDLGVFLKKINLLKEVVANLHGKQAIS